jgi:hypothetical protein
MLRAKPHISALPHASPITCFFPKCSLRHSNQISNEFHWAEKRRNIVIFSPFDVGFGIEAENQSQNFNGVCLY